MPKVNIAIAGGPCTGKSTLAARLYSQLKVDGFDYDLIMEECKKMKVLFGTFRSPFERFYFWRIQERQELLSNAENGFITDKPLFQYYAQVRQFAFEPRDKLALKELYDMCTELDKRYNLIIMAKNPCEIEYKKTNTRVSDEPAARERHEIIYNLVNHLWPEKLLLINGSLEERLEQSVKKIKGLHHLIID
jgi:nicotinamide riboside kinase